MARIKVAFDSPGRLQPDDSDSDHLIHTLEVEFGISVE